MLIPYVPMLVPPRKWKGYDIDRKVMFMLHYLFSRTWRGCTDQLSLICCISSHPLRKKNKKISNYISEIIQVKFCSQQC